MRVRKVNSNDVKIHDSVQVKLKTAGNTSVVQFTAGNNKSCPVRNLSKDTYLDKKTGEVKTYILMRRKECLEILNKIRKRRLKLGDIYEISLPNGKKAYGRLYKEYVLAIYEKMCDDVSELPEENEYRFFVGVYKDLLQDGVWPVVANRKFASDEDAWAPPQCVVDAITKIGSLYYKGEIIPCSYEECKDLEVVSAWDRHHVIDRIMGIDTWEKSIRKPINPSE